MKKTTEKLLKVAEYGVAGVIWSYDYAQFVKRHEEAAKRMTTLDKNATKKEKIVAGTKQFGACYMEGLSFGIASTMFSKALLTGVELVKELKK